jgi:hypothetical protein
MPGNENKPARDNGATGATSYELNRVVLDNKTRVATELTRQEINRRHLAAVFREVDALVYRDLRIVRVTFTEFCSEIVDDLSGRRLVSFLVSSGPVYDIDNDDTDSLDVTALRRQLLGANYAEKKP